MREDWVRDGPASGEKGSKGESFIGGNPYISIVMLARDGLSTEQVPVSA
eukprot:CAMPEP_0180145106 /NCGR_PEP_ID=MMETSP0986-20121125/17440_1 /TAXON_ID=697907 /ORGANISM="non described non described, Strain CCMP2293" /LENGTH=48 /DNA_ID= /DNA_START= /DNA_END= /DNA_ORIENTATION=